MRIYWARHVARMEEVKTHTEACYEIFNLHNEEDTNNGFQS